MFYTKKSFFEVTRLINSYEKNIDIVDDVSSFLEEKQEFHPFDRLLIKKLNNQALDSPRAIRYFEGRRISKESVSSLSLGYSEKQDMVTVPISTPDGSDFVGFVGRSIEGKSFRNTPGLPKSKVLFNLHRNKYKDHVYVVESSFDAIRLHQCGVSAVSTLGSSVSKKQIDLLKKYFNYVILIPDNDDAGRDMSKKITEVLGKQSISIGLPNRFKDIGDLADSDILELTKRVDDPLLAIY
jgi:DNA primase